jgi:predicted metal-dependent enzyme (double-stranded beta helix superfamily)
MALHTLVDGLRGLDLAACPDDAVGALLGVAIRKKPAIRVATTTEQPRAYTRTLLFRDDAFELLALYWPDGASTGIHDHGTRRCWFGLATGRMRVDNFRRTDDGTVAGRATLAPQPDSHLAPGDLDVRSNDLDLHRCVALEPATMTIHVYARPLERFHLFDETTETYDECAPTYDAQAIVPS